MYCNSDKLSNDPIHLPVIVSSKNLNSFTSCLTSYKEQYIITTNLYKMLSFSSLGNVVFVKLYA